MCLAMCLEPPSLYYLPPSLSPPGAKTFAQWLVRASYPLWLKKGSSLASDLCTGSVARVQHCLHLLPCLALQNCKSLALHFLHWSEQCKKLSNRLQLAYFTTSSASALRKGCTTLAWLEAAQGRARLELCSPLVRGKSCAS